MFMPTILAIVCLVSSSTALVNKPFYQVEDAENMFNEYVKEHKKTYNRREFYERLEIFKESLKRINERNAMFPDTVFAVNHLSDLKPHELQQYRGFKLPPGNITKLALPDLPTPTDDHFDWRDKHAVTPVKDQKQCGSCYIFSSVGAIEGQYAIKHQKCLAFSEEQALDCLDCGSCAGGIMDAVFQELAQKKKKLEKQEDYPYVAPPKQLCKEDASKGIAEVTGGKPVHIADEEELRKLLVKYGPLSVALAADDFNDYKSGVLEPDMCTGQDLNHGVTLVGYGEENGKKYWLIKNSWGTIWGEKGYVKLLRGVNACKMGTGYTATCSVA